MPFDKKLLFTVFGRFPFAILFCSMSYKVARQFLTTGIWNFEISHEIFHVLDFLHMEICLVLYYSHVYYCNPKSIYCQVSVSWGGGARTKGKGRECKLTENNFFHRDLLRLCQKKKRKITEFFPDTTDFYMRQKDRVILTNNIVLYRRLTYVEPYKDILENFCTKMQFRRLV